MEKSGQSSAAEVVVGIHADHLADIRNDFSVVGEALLFLELNVQWQTRLEVISNCDFQLFR